MDGILNLSKPQGWTSHDAVARVRRLTGQRRVGHAGTLDPLATGVLLVCLGQATRVAEYLMASDKIYLAHVRLGAATDTYDATGEIMCARPVETNLAQLEAALARFVGEIEQVPPMYSALKREGQPLYKLARRGVEVERPARRVRISKIVLRQVRLPDFAIEVHCSSGTYIRSLAHDIGQALGCGAHMTALARLASGTFALERAAAWEQVEQAASQERLAELLYPLDAALQDWPAVTLDADMTQRARQGQGVRLPLAPAPLCRAYDAQGKLVALLVYRDEMWRPDKVFA